MKKALVLLLALCAVSAFAQDAAYDIEAEASVTWGYNLNDDSQGFVNEMSFELTFPLIAGESAATEGEGVYGELSITGINLALFYNSDDDAGSIIDNYDEDGFYDEISAKIIAGAMYVTIWEAPGFELNNAEQQGPLSIDDWDDASIMADTAGSTGGITFGYKTEMFDVALQLASNGSYESATDATDDVWEFFVAQADIDLTANDAEDDGIYFDLDATTDLNGTTITAGQQYLMFTPAAPAGATNVDAEYTVGLTLTVTPIEMLEIEFAAFADMWKDANKGLTLKATVTPIEGLEAVVAFDGSIVADLDLAWDSSFGVTYTLANASEVAFNSFFTTGDSVDTLSGAPLGTAKNAYLELGLTVTEDGEEGFVPALGASAYFKGYDLLNAYDTDTTTGIPAWVGFSVDYTVTLEEGKTVKPYATFDMGLLEIDGVDDTNGFAFTVGVDVEVIANTTITAEFAGGEITDDDETLVGPGAITPFGDATGFDKGLFTVSCTIAF